MEDAIELEKGLKPRGEKIFFHKKITMNNIPTYQQILFYSLSNKNPPQKIGTKFQSFIDHFQV